jgi:hypothetical protein
VHVEPARAIIDGSTRCVSTTDAGPLQLRRALLAQLAVGLPGLPQRDGDLARQLDRERRPDADLGVALDRAAVALDELVHDRQAQAGAFADVLGREERVPDPRQDVGRDALAVVLDLHLDGARVASGLAGDRRVALA